MIYIYSPVVSSGARALRDALVGLGTQARLLRRPRPTLAEDDLVVIWGHEWPLSDPWQGRFLNFARPGGKLTQFRTLHAAGVQVPEFRSPGDIPDESETWLPRSSHHTGGADLLNPPAIVDMWVRFMTFEREFRIHTWRIPSGDYVSARVGLKVPAEDHPSPHPWVRSYDAGWRLSYGKRAQDAIRQNVRDAASASVRALGLDFGAVDIGVRPGGHPIVLEVNRAPGMEGTTPEVYARKVMLWAGAE
jgi:hypothetical protein